MAQWVKNPTGAHEDAGCLFVSLFRAEPVVYGSSQARGQITAAAVGLHHSHSNARSELRL